MIVLSGSIEFAWLFLVMGVTGLAEEVASTEGKILVTLLAILGAVLASWFARRAQSQLKRFVSPTVADLIASVVVIGVFATAVGLLVELWGLSNDVLAEIEAFELSAVIPQLIVTVLVLVGAQVFTGVIRRLLDDLMGSSDAVTRHQRQVTYRLSQLLIWTFALFVVLGVWQVNVSGLLVGAGFLGIVVGMAARQTLGSLLAGFVLMFSRPFEIGDWVQVGRDDQEGIVTDITMMNTRIETVDGEYVMVPNDVISSQAIVNRSRKGRLRVDIEVGVDYDTDLERAKELALDAVEDVEDAEDAPTPQVVSKRFGDSAILLGVRFWIDSPSARRYNRARTQAIGSIKDRYDEAGITIPFPQRTVGRRSGATEAVDFVSEPSPGGDE
ncbi:mechanosensitive ion channel family protein [Natranaeroarchaeum aerophilus]|uniref:Mechanosensitive ion channel family protein n=1 Tax=Natranaeroarchaeum aerophilus TaxID=2917711 RepID=A0AAE3K537_9EURY|nr:mechanosensitive ion channel family protein [Natranaeroarchaeum aerophilus]